MRPFHLVLAGVIAMIAVPPAFAQQRHHARHHHFYPPPYAYGGEGETVRAATARAQNEPGLAQEIDPSSSQTATGGPSGGLRSPF